MPGREPRPSASPQRIKASLFAAIVAAAVVSLAAGVSDGGAAPQAPATTKLILFEMGFPCSLVGGVQELCNGVAAAAKHLPPGYEVQIKTGTNYADTSAFNNLIQTSLQLKPAGIVVFPSGPVAETPYLNRACSSGVKVIVFESVATGVKCQTAFVGSNSYGLGALDAQWLVKNRPTSKDVGIVTQPPGEFTSTDDRVRGFAQALEKAGFNIVATAITTGALDTTRTEVTNMLTAHPTIGAVFAANGPMGSGALQALTGKSNIALLTLDPSLGDVPNIENGSISADATANDYQEGMLAVQTMVKALQGKNVPASSYAPSVLVDKTNAAAWASAHKKLQQP
jgi:ribose transport system substrate-binding protein